MTRDEIIRQYCTVFSRVILTKTMKLRKADVIALVNLNREARRVLARPQPSDRELAEATALGITVEELRCGKA